MRQTKIRYAHKIACPEEIAYNCVERELSLALRVKVRDTIREAHMRVDMSLVPVIAAAVEWVIHHPDTD